MRGANIFKSVSLNMKFDKFISPYLLAKESYVIFLSGRFALHTASRALCCWDITFRSPTTAAKFIIKSLLFLLKVQRS
jgi:hypothetical protein